MLDTGRLHYLGSEVRGGRDLFPVLEFPQAELTWGSEFDIQ